MAESIPSKIYKIINFAENRQTHMSETMEQARIYGKEIFFRFIEVPAAEIGQNGHLVRQLRNGELEGFIAKGVFNLDEVAQLKAFLETMPHEEYMNTPSGKIFPAPFATITNAEDRLDNYFQNLQHLNSYINSVPAVKNLSEKLDAFFRNVAADFEVSIPVNKIKEKPVAPGTFRLFYPDMGGLHVHCGLLFQAQSMFYYSLLKNDVDMDEQLSYFVVLQQSEEGGELTIYDMLWDKVKRKESPENNDFVIDENNNHIYLENVRNFAVKPLPGDILVFSGGPIWHRVENIKGQSPRITFGGFLNFSNNDKELYYWS